MRTTSFGTKRGARNSDSARVCLLGVWLGLAFMLTVDSNPLLAEPAPAPTTPPSHSVPKPAIESVMPPGMRITATTASGTIEIRALDQLSRTYTWEGATRGVELWPRQQRWYGSLGLYYPGPGDHWAEHNGITRGVLEEGQQHFKSLAEARQWLAANLYFPAVYRDDGLVVSWGKVLQRRQLTVSVWQIYIAGRKPAGLPGSHNNAIKVTFSAPPNRASLAEAVRANDLKVVQKLLDSGADPDASDPSLSPPVAIATSKGYTAILEALLNHRAAVNSHDPNHEGATPLLLAAETGRTDIVNLLLKHGADPNAAFERGILAGQTALMLGAMANNVPLARLLLDHGALVDQRASDGQTALSLAASQDKSGVVQLLLHRGADVNAPDQLGQTPLMHASLFGGTITVKALLNAGANVNARDDAARVAYARAQFMGDSATMDRIERSGRLKTLHEDGNSALDFAASVKNSGVVQLLKKAGAK